MSSTAPVSAIDATADVMVRPATEADLPAVLALYGQPDLDGENVIGLSPALAIFRRMQAHPSQTLLVAVTEDRIVGTFMLLIAENLAHGGACSALVESVVVAADMQGRGIGRAMMADAMARARARGCYKLALSSNLKRNGAHAFYDRLGFARHGVSFVIDPREAPDASR